MDVIVFMGGYAVVSRWATGGGIVNPKVITGGDDATVTVLAAIVAGLLAVAVWRVARLLVVRTRVR